MAIDSQVARLLTAEDLFRMPEDGFRYELVRGELIQMPPAGEEPGSIVVRLSWRLAQYVETNHLGIVLAAETGFQLEQDPNTVRAADVAFVRRERVEQTGVLKGYRPGAPDLAVEVISPHDSYSKVKEKALKWLDAGAKMVVIVDPSEQDVTLYRSREDVRVLTKNETLDGGDVVPGWTMPVKELFVQK